MNIPSPLRFTALLAGMLVLGSPLLAQNNQEDNSSRRNRRSSKSNTRAGSDSAAGDNFKNTAGESSKSKKTPTEKKATAEPAKQRPAPKAPAAAGNRPARAGAGATSQNSVPIAAAPALGLFTLNLDTKARMLRVHPQGASSLQDGAYVVGSEFRTEITLDNPALEAVDSVRIILSYEPEFIEPLAISDVAIAATVQGTPITEVDPRAGIILYDAQLNTPLTTNGSPILSIRWNAKSITRTTTIEFASRGPNRTLLASGDMDMLGSAEDPADGTLNMTLRILPADQREAQALLFDPVIYTGAGEKRGGVELSLVLEDPNPIVGEPFAIDVVLDNNAYSLVDGLNVILKFDPDVLTIVDADKDNWITRETNILDGPFKTQFPWSFHIANQAHNRTGEIIYRMGCTDPELTRGKSGTVARIYAIARTPAVSTPITFRFLKNERGRSTAVSFNGLDCLGDPDTFGDGATGIVIPIKNAR